MSTREEAGRRAEATVREFIDQMAAAGNPGAGRHEIGVHHVVGWILEYDGTAGGFEIQAVIGLDGSIHGRRERRSMRTHTWTASEWILRDEQGDAMAAAAKLGDQLAGLRSFDTRDLDEPWGGV